ncbi:MULTISPECIES: Crp/Fnr family transcriptional regulator [Niastella]
MGSELTNHLSSIVKTANLKKNVYLVKVGNVCKYVCFVKEGLLKCSSLDNGKKACYWFVKENDIITPFEIGFEQVRCKESIQALEDCTLQYVTYSELQDIYFRFPEFYVHRETFIDKYVSLLDERAYILAYCPPDRYKILLQRQPEWIRRVHNRHISSYLRVPLSIVCQLKKMTKQTLAGHIKLS